MRLFDQIIGSRAQVNASDPAGIIHNLPGVADKASIIAECGLRYVVDREASRQCFDLIREDSGLLEPESDLLRLPAGYFWLEWVGEPARLGAKEPKLGALVEAEPDGRSGSVTGFWQDERGLADMAVGTIRFDLDHVLAPPPGSGIVFRLRHGAFSHLDRLFAHALFHLDPLWARFLLASGQYDRKVRELVEGVWHNLPFAFAFAAMLNSEGVLDERSSDLSRLNRARMRRGRQPLLDHVEARLNFNPTRPRITAAGPSDARAAPRLHLVRGHVVRRQGKSFWRVAHLRGDCARPIPSKTVTVCGAGL